MGKTLAINPFVLRQTENSRFSHYEGCWPGLLQLVADNFDPSHPQQQGYRPGVYEVPVPPQGFFSNVVELKEGDQLFGSFKARRAGETPRKVITTKSRRKTPAGSATIILYSSKVLAEDGSNKLTPLPGNYEIVSINCDLAEKLPIDPITLMHNHFGSDGGTDTKMTGAEFLAQLRESFLAHLDKVSCG